MTYNKPARHYSTPSFSYNPKAAEPKDTHFNDGQWTNGKLACSWCDEIIPGGETYFDIPGQGILCESCAKYKFGHKAPYYNDLDVD